MPLPKEQIYTADDIYNLPDGERAELIDGQIYYMSPSSSRRMDYYTKLFKYRTAGVREYWIVDADRKSVMVYNFQNDDAANYAFNDNIPAGIYQGFSINLSTLDIYNPT